MAEQSVRLVQISDLHIFGDDDRELLGVKTRQSFNALFDLLKVDKSQPDLIILSGDLSQDGSQASYRYVADKMQLLSIPTYYVAGNHDNSDVMDSVYPYGVMNKSKHIVLDHWQIILLDSHIHGKVHGHLAETELSFLESCLKKYPQKTAMIVFHHHPIPVGCVWLDKLGVHNADEFWSLLKNYPQVHTILFGHVHQQHEGIKNNIRYYSVPSTCIQFKCNVVDFALDKIPPTYRWVELLPNGELKTGIKQVNQYIGHFDESAKGY